MRGSSAWKRAVAHRKRGDDARREPSDIGARAQWAAQCALFDVATQELLIVRRGTFSLAPLKLVERLGGSGDSQLLRQRAAAGASHGGARARARPASALRCFRRPAPARRC